jgi:hypothetical protein
LDIPDYFKIRMRRYCCVNFHAYVCTMHPGLHT